MERIFKGLNLELVAGKISYKVDEVFLEKDQFVLILTNLPKGSFNEAEMIISDNNREYVSLKPKIVDIKYEAEKVKLFCFTSSKKINLLKRSLLRLQTDIRTEYSYLRAEGEGRFSSISAEHIGALKDLNTCGASLEVANYGSFFLEEPFSYLRLLFTLPDEASGGKKVEVIGRVVNVTKSWDKISVGILFVHQNESDAKWIEEFYQRGLGSIENREENSIVAEIKKFFTK